MEGLVGKKVRIKQQYVLQEVVELSFHEIISSRVFLSSV